jgi:hypothetical protein
MDSEIPRSEAEPQPKRGKTAAARHEASRRVRAAIDEFLQRHTQVGAAAHPIDERARAVLDRLAALGLPSDRLTAAEAIVQGVPPDGWEWLFADCVVAEHRARTHAEGVAKAQMVLQGASEAGESIDRLKRFFKAAYRSPAGCSDPVDDALATLRAALDANRRLASDHLELSSRKVTSAAARAEGIGWIRESIQRSCELACVPASPAVIAAICTAALGMGEVTPDAARKAETMRNRLWQLRHPGSPR